MEEKKVEEAAAKSSGISSSKAKREEKAKKAAELKKSAMLSKIIWVVVGILLAALVVVLIVNKAVVASKQITASNDYSAMLEDTGLMKGVTASKCVNLCDYKNIVVPLSEIEYTDEEVDADIQQALEVHKVLNSEEGTVADGDKINLDYVGKIDGEEFEGGNTNGNGYDLTIGSGSFIQGFEDQLIGAKVGDMVTVDVTFPEGYSNADVAGKDAQFDCTINGIYELGTFDDDFVKEYYSDYADTVEGYRQYLKDTNYEKRFEAYVKSYVVDNSEVTSYPAKYLKHLKETTYYDDLQTYDYMNQMYIQYSGSGFSSFEEYIGKSMDEYFESLDETCKSSEKTSLICQAIIEQEGITLTDDDLKAAVGEETSDEDLQTMITTYGKGYLMQSAIATRAYEIAKENAVVQ